MEAADRGWKVGLLLGPVVLASLVQGAHFLRSGGLVLTAASALLPLILLVRRAWAVRVMQLALAHHAFSWIWSAIALMRERQLLGVPYLRMLVILGAVGLFTAASALLLEAGPLRRKLRQPHPPHAP